MIANKTVDQITELLRNSNLTWLLPNLRQDFVVWNNLIDPEFYDMFSQLKPAGSEISPLDFSPSRLALIALNQSVTGNIESREWLDSIDSQVLQLAIRSFNDQTLLQANPQNLATAGLIALALAYKFRTTNNWNGLLDPIQDKPGIHWLSPLVCLYGLVEDTTGMLHSLVQPGASPFRLELAAHVVLSNPLPTDEQVAIIMDLCHGVYGDLLPARERYLLVRSLCEQRPQTAVDFCSSWLEIHPERSNPAKKNHNIPIENINQLAENLFQIEVHKIAGATQTLPELLDDEKEITYHLSNSLINHYASQVTKYRTDKFITAELSNICDQILHPNGHSGHVDKYSPAQAELALILADQGFQDTASQLLPGPGDNLPKDPEILYSIAMLSEKAEDDQHAVEAASRIVELLDQKPSIYTIPVWGDHLSLVNLGKLLLELHKADQASHIFELALETCPNEASLLILLADSYKSTHKEQEATEILRTLVSLNPTNTDYRRAFAQSLESIGDWESGLNERSYIVEFIREQSKTPSTDDIYAYANCALNANHPDLTLIVCSDLLTRNNEDSQALIYTGKAYLMTNEFDQGLEFLIRATQVSPHCSEAWLALADAQKEIYPLKTVIDTLNNASQAVPESSQIHFALGELYLQDNTPTLALPELKSADTLSPGNPQILFTCGIALEKLGHIEESRDVLAEAYHLAPTLPGLAQLYAKILVDMGELEEAISPLEVLIKSKSSNDPMAYMDYARCVLSLNKLGSPKISPMRALIALNEVLQLDPDNAEAKALIAESLAANGDKEMAFQAYREALDTSLIEDKNWLERLSFGFGCVASSIGKHDIAVAALQEAGQVNSNNPQIFMALSDAYLAAGLPEDAIRAARNVLVIDGEDPNNLSWFARQAANFICKEKSDTSNSATPITKTVPSEALNALAKAIQLAPTRTDLLVQLGNFQSSIGALADAQETFTSIAILDFAEIEDLKSASAYLSEMGDHVAAIACLENGIAQDQENVTRHDSSLYAILAREYVKNNDHSSAINTLDKAIEIIPDDDALVSLKIDILLSLGQSIEALNCIETAIQKQDGTSSIDLLILGSRINRSIGDFSAAIKYAQKGISTGSKDGYSGNLPLVPIQYRTYIAEIYRALIQPDHAYNIIHAETTTAVSDFNDEQSYLDFIFLHTELALETGDQSRPDFQEIQLDPSNPSFSRLMAIKARLMNKAGNYKQAEQILQIALKSIANLDHPADMPSWTAAYAKYLAMNSIVEACLDLGLWDQAVLGAQQILESYPGEPMPYLILAKAIVHKVEFYNLCNITQVIKHKPAVDSNSKETFNQFVTYIDKAKSVLEPYQSEAIIAEYELTDDQIYRWQARAEIAFNVDERVSFDPMDILAHRLTPGDAAAMIYHLHQLDLRDADSDSVTRIIKIARSFPRNLTVLLQVALAIHDDNPADAMKSLQSVLEQNPYSKGPIVAFCNNLLAKIAFNLEEYDIAQQAIENAIEIWQDEPEWHNFAAQIFKQTSATNAAVKHLLEATRLDSKNISYHMELGKAYYENANDDPRILKQALISFENALGIDSKDVPALILLANTQSLLNDLENAEANARNALMLSPNRADIYQLLSEIAIKNNDYQGAYEYANKAIQLSPKDLQSTIILARSLSALGRYDEALAKIDAMISALPEARLLHLERVNILRKINGPKSGLNELKTLVNSYPDDFNILSALAKSYIEAGESDNALNIAQLALKASTEKTSHNDQANIHLLIGQVLRQSGLLDQSIQHLSEAIQLAPDRLEPYLELGLARKERREYQQALQIFEQATSIAPDDPRAPFQAGLALKESKDYKSSETMLRRAVSLAPNDLNIRRQLAAVVALNLVHNPRMGRN